jgi:hypothetical protein
MHSDENVNLINQQSKITEALRNSNLDCSNEMFRSDDIIEIEMPFHSMDRYDGYLPPNE